ncbi:Tet(A)/Tet(B)/Tet(C) family tetracycline efflux MFS transporter [Caulobacter segnis]|uniref:Tet(A)/Tet(B)/Tet(C) family tetracycline efflux MFS transporter n=1 Tax=Caulobacter segnis TaxID=88688 RepID=UPI001CBFAAD0|nr:Tet(A)/Tet(B)/Tet(C) family tetracycline efflux MFS transporter [Caulobacter segnis]UAL09881.1 Tet(A)/Tet(B)/Tet(C) family tetracycline efflux MFS transporter [Caulobacter segnis]
MTRIFRDRSKAAFGLILATVALDIAGLGLVMPIIPRLLREVGHTGDLGWRFGAFLGLYALMQFLCAPVLGAISDKVGRRPVLLVSLAGAAIDYVFMAFAPTLAWLFVGRAIAGITGANLAVAQAYIADITPEEQRARRFGLFSAMFGIGFILGPLLGGFLGAAWVRAPFLAAAALNGVNLLMAIFILPESHKGKGGAFDRKAFNPFASLRWAAAFPALLPLMVAFAALNIVGEVGGTIWVLYGEDKFAWDPWTIGFSLAGFGAFTALTQAFVAGPLAERFGERKALTFGILCDAFAYVAIALATKGWMAFLLLPMFCLGGVGQPVIQSLLSRQVGEDQQGRLQGVLASLASLASIIGPVVIAQVYFASRAWFPGLVWVAGAALGLMCLPIFLTRRPDGPQGKLAQQD